MVRVDGSSFDLLINSHKLILFGVHHEYTVLFRQGNSELATWCGFPLSTVLKTLFGSFVVLLREGRVAVKTYISSLQ